MVKLNEDGNAAALISAILMLIIGAATVFILVPTITSSITSQVVGTPSGEWANVYRGITDTFGAMETMMKIMLLAVVGITIIYMVRWVGVPHDSNVYEEEIPSNSSTPPQTVVNNIPHATMYVAGGGGAGGSGGSGSGHTPPYYPPYPAPSKPPMEYEPLKPKKPIVDRDGVEDDDPSFIEVLD